MTSLCILSFPRILAKESDADARPVKVAEAFSLPTVRFIPFDKMPAVETDESLLLKAGKGDAKAFGKLYDRISPPLFGLLRQLLGDAKEAEDALQDCFVYLWQKASSYDSQRSKAFTWAVMVFRNRAIDRLRARGRRTKITEAVANEASLFNSSPATAEHEAGIHERAVLLRNALHLLPDQQRSLIEFAFFSGETHEFIAQKLEMPLGTVKTNIRRGMLRLRDLMKGGEE